MVIDNDGSNLLGKRMQVVDRVRFELMGCENIGRFHTCTFTLTNLDVDRELRFGKDTCFFDEAGAPLSHKSEVQLLRNVPTAVKLVLEETDRKVEHSPSVKFVMSTRDND